MRPFRTPVQAAGLGVSLVLMVFAVGLGRVDLAVAGVVLLVAVSVTARRPTTREHPTVTLTVAPQAPTTGRSLRVGVALEPHRDVDLVAVRLHLLGTELRRVAVAGDCRGFTVDVPIVHTGTQEFAAAQARTASADVVWIADSLPIVPARVTIEPRARDVPFLPLPARLRGLTGGHDSSRPGDGGEFHDIHPFASGDRLRRIDWRATARLGRSPGDLFVRRTHATSDARVSLVLDDAVDVGSRVADWPTGDVRLTGTTSLDLAREASWSLAAEYLSAGDSVSFQVLSRARGTVPPGSGSRHGQRLQQAIARVSARPRGFTRSRTPLVATGALIVLLATFLDDDPARLAQLWRASGHRVIVVDVLPRCDTAALTREQRLALRVVLGRRRDRLADLRATGVDVVVWDAPASDRRAVLQALARPRRAS
jgi:uncharacterized protein (DUF58 family)